MSIAFIVTRNDKSTKTNVLKSTNKSNVSRRVCVCFLYRKRIFGHVFDFRGGPKRLRYAAVDKNVTRTDDVQHEMAELGTIAWRGPCDLFFRISDRVH